MPRTLTSPCPSSSLLLSADALRHARNPGLGGVCWSVSGSRAHLGLTLGAGAGSPSPSLHLQPAQLLERLRLSDAFLSHHLPSRFARNSNTRPIPSHSASHDTTLAISTPTRAANLDPTARLHLASPPLIHDASLRWIEIRTAQASATVCLILQRPALRSYIL